MKKFGVRYTPECARLISKLPPEVKRLVRSAIDSLRAKPTTGRELTGELEGYRSQPMRRYRIIYRMRQSLTLKFSMSDTAEMYTKHLGRCC